MQSIDSSAFKQTNKQTNKQTKTIHRWKFELAVELKSVSQMQGIQDEKETTEQEKVI